jgi:hypothetical protein
MGDDILTRLLLLIVGTALGIVGGIAGTAIKSYYERKAELDKRAEMTWLNTLSPLRVAAKDLREYFNHAFERVYAERGKNLNDGNYYLRNWFRQCKDYIEPNEQWSNEARREHIAMHSGGMGAEAVSTLYTTAYYLYYATQVRLRMPSIESKKKAHELLHYIEAVRSSFEKIEFYLVTQDSTGVSMKNSSGEVMNYREFCEALTDKSQRGWFLTLTDVYYKLDRWEPDDVKPILQALDALVEALGQK